MLATILAIVLTALLFAAWVIAIRGARQRTGTYKYEQKPGPGQITLAKQLGRRPGENEDAQMEFWLREVQALYQHYRGR